MLFIDYNEPGFSEVIMEKMEQEGFNVRIYELLGNVGALSWDDGQPAGYADTRRIGGVFVK